MKREANLFIGGVGLLLGIGLVAIAARGNLTAGARPVAQELQQPSPNTLEPPPLPLSGPGQANSPLLFRPGAVASPPLPPEVAFAGERVPTEDPLVREALETHLVYTVFNADYTLMILKRAQRWREPMLKLLRAAQLPDDFFYLMVAESGVRNIQSPAGAHGYWQFMPATAREYGMVVDRYVDQRLDPYLATQAAIGYLKAAYAKLNNWALVAAAYNMGTGGVLYNLGKQGLKDYHALRWNSQTGHYLYRIVALKIVLENPQAYGYRLQPNDYYPKLPFKEVPVSGPIDDLYAFARQQGTTYKLLKHQNPWLLADKLPYYPGRSFLFRITTPEQAKAAGEL